MKHFFYLLFSLLSIAFCKSISAEGKSGPGEGERPNILWINSEDNGTYIGCYGDKVAQTPNLDLLAQQGFRYTNCFANAPVCAVMRSSWILGIPAITTGTHHMRSKFRVPESLLPYPALLKEAGYYMTSNGRTDYNNSSFDSEIWDEYGRRAHYRNRPEGKPFFHNYNILATHEGQIFNDLYPEKYPLEGSPSKEIIIPPYQVETPENYADWQRVYERVSDMDSQVGEYLRELKESGEAENTIVVYCPDHGGITLRSKRYLFDSGTRVPLIIYVPEKWKHLAPGKPGAVIDRLVQYIDMPRTFLSLAGAELPDRMPGRVFMGPGTEPAPEHVFLFSDRFVSSPDMSRAITDGRWKYIRNYEPDRPRLQMIYYPLLQRGQSSQYREYQAGRTNPVQSEIFSLQPFEELYDTREDPYEIKNLAGLPAFSDKLEEMRQELDRQILEARDAGFLPEPLMADMDLDKSTSIYDFCQSADEYHLEEIMEIAFMAAEKDPDHIPELVQNLNHDDPTMRFWAIQGLRILGRDARPALKDIESALEDAEASVRINAMMALGNTGQTKRAGKLLIEEARTAVTDAHANWALFALKYLDAPEAIAGVKEEDVVRGSDSRVTYRSLKAGGTMYQPPVDIDLRPKR
jgi:arylsulfatase A-like enzyme